MTHHFLFAQMLVHVKVVEFSYVKEHIINCSATYPKFKRYQNIHMIPLENEM